MRKMDARRKLREEQAARLKAARVAAGFTKAADAIRRHNFSASTYHAHENAQNGIQADAAILYGKKFNVDGGWIITGSGKGPVSEENIYPDDEDFDDHDFIKVPRYDAAFSMGAGALVADHPKPMGYWPVESQWLSSLTRSKPEHLVMVRTDGDSMIPTLLSGDWVLIDKSQTRISREGIYAIRVFDDVWIKRLSLNLHDKTIRVISDNSTIPVQTVTEDELSVIGRVISLVARSIA